MTGRGKAPFATALGCTLMAQGADCSLEEISSMNEQSAVVREETDTTRRAWGEARTLIQDGIREGF